MFFCDNSVYHSRSALGKVLLCSNSFLQRIPKGRRKRERKEKKDEEREENEKFESHENLGFVSLRTAIKMSQKDFSVRMRKEKKKK